MIKARQIAHNKGLRLWSKFALSLRLIHDFVASTLQKQTRMADHQEGNKLLKFPKAVKGIC